MSAAARARIAAAQRKRWAEARKQAGAFAHPNKAQTERGRTTGDHRGHEAALDGIPEGARAVIDQILRRKIAGP
jgi:hypothetical protein